MRLIGFILITMLSLACLVSGWPVSHPEVLKTMGDIPQWHCLRYFKHDIHLMRRCRNYRVPMLRRPFD